MGEHAPKIEMFSSVLSRTVPRAAHAGPALSRKFAAIPINQVARIYKMNVGNEEGADKVEALLNETLPKMANVPGYVKTIRTTCKSEFEYEVMFVFDSLDSFKTHDSSENREKELMPGVAKLKELAVGDIYAGVRVFDEK